MGKTVRIGKPGGGEIAIALRRSMRARRLSLRVSSLDGRVTLTMPSTLAEADALRFAAARADWIARHLDSRQADRPVRIGTELQVDGSPRIVAASHGRKTGLTETSLLVRPDRPAGPQVAACLKHAARARLADACKRHATLLGREMGRLTLRDTRSRWGSCAASGNLMFSWRLILAPPDVLDYVAAHEVAHLRHMDHSTAFWETTAQLCPDYRSQRAWLRKNGAALHAWRFED